MILRHLNRSINDTNDFELAKIIILWSENPENDY